MLDITAYLDDENIIQYKGFSKPTDAKRYLDTRSFHPRSVFQSIPFSQIIRIMENNSKEDTRNEQVNELITHFENSGYKSCDLQKLKEKAINRTSNTAPAVSNSNESDNNNDDNNKTLIFPIYYFDKLHEFQSMVRDLKDDFQQLIGNTRVMFAIKKGSSIGSTLVRNKALCESNSTDNSDQKCNGSGCQQCPLVNPAKKIVINDTKLSIPMHLNCKSRNVIYLWKCKLCESECYFGRTCQKCHSRTNGHRGCFSDEKWEKSALAMHAKDVHNSNFSLKNFTISIVKKISPQQIRREEFRFIEKYRTIQLGLNRYKPT